MKKLVLAAILFGTLVFQGKAQTQPCFNAPVNYPLANKPLGIVSADFNGDAKPDLAVANNNSHVISILTNQGTGSFSVTATYPVANDPGGVIAADLNGDGQPDLAVASYNSAAISVLINSGSGSFAPAVQYGGLNEILSITSADFNGDGKADLAAVAYTASASKDIAVYLNTGSGVFSSPALYSTGISYTENSGITSGDFDGDGKPDLAVSSYSKISVLINNGSGTFGTGTSYPCKSGIGVICGDFNGDGLTDLVASTWQKGAEIFLNGGGGTFNAPTIVPGLGCAMGLAKADFNGDGKLDVALQTPNGIVCLTNDGSGTFSKTAAYSFYATVLPKARGYSAVFNTLCSADFDGDGTFDVAGTNPYIANSSFSELNVLLHCQAPAPPTANFSNMPTSLCLGGSVDATPNISGTPPQTFYLNTPLVSPQADTALAVCRNKNSVFVLFAGDSARRYDLLGNYQFTYPFLPLGSHAIAADSNNRLFVVAPDGLNPAISQISCYDATGNMDFTFWNNGPTTPNYLLNYIAGIAVGPDGKLYAADTLADIKVLTTDNSAQISSIPTPSNLQYSLYKPMGICFGKAGQMYVADAGVKNILARNPSDNNFYPVFPGLTANNWEMSSVDVDTLLNNMFFTTRNSPYRVVRAQAAITFGDTLCTYDTLSSHVTFSAPGNVIAVNQQNSATVWVADTKSTTLNRINEFTYQLIPALPAGLSFEPFAGGITGTPTGPSPLTTYSLIVSNQLGTDTTTFSFAVDPPGPVSNTTGTLTASGNQTDGLTIRYFNTNNCAEMLEIADEVGGGMPGGVAISQTVTPTISVFNADTFINRVTQIDAQDPLDSAFIKIYYTYLDILHYNQSFGQTILSNDTLAGTMKVAVLQLHESPPLSGHFTPIKHSPITATWSTTKHHWEVNFAIKKFSAFYMGDTLGVDAFTCETSGTDTIVTTSNYYIWNGDTLNMSGTYVDTLVNVTGCDSIATLELTINSSGISTPLLEKAVTVYPNPSTGLLNVKVSDPNVQINTINIVNLFGAGVYNSNESKGSVAIDLSYLPKGVYIISVTSQYETMTRRILIQ